LLACGLLPSVFFLIGGAWPGPEATRLAGIIAAYGLGALPYLYVYRGWRSFPHCHKALIRLLLVAATARVVLLLLPPLLSEDLWRYLWDGSVQWSGINPYAHAPNSAAVDAVATTPTLEAIRARIGHAHIPTIYPPAAQVVFGAATVAGPSSAVMRLFMIGADLLVVLGLWRWSQRRGSAPQVAILYAFAPLAIAESAIGSHVDAVGVAALVLTGSALAAGRWGRAGVALAVSVGTKLMPVLVFPTLCGRHWKAVAVAVVVCVALGLPYLDAGGELLEGLRSYGHRWRANDGAFALILAGFHQIWTPSATPVALDPHWVQLVRGLVGPSQGALPHQVWPDELAFAATKLVVGGLFGLVLLHRLWRARSLEGFFGPVVVALMLLSPVVHPWYLLWGLPFALLALARVSPQPTVGVLAPAKSHHRQQAHGAGPVFWARPFLLWTGLVFLAYVPRPHYLQTGQWIVEPGLRLLEYVPVWTALVVGAALAARAKWSHWGT